MSVYVGKIFWYKVFIWFEFLKSCCVVIIFFDTYNILMEACMIHWFLLLDMIWILVFSCNHITLWYLCLNKIPLDHTVFITFLMYFDKRQVVCIPADNIFFPNPKQHQNEFVSLTWDINSPLPSSFPRIQLCKAEYVVEAQMLESSFAYNQNSSQWYDPWKGVISLKKGEGRKRQESY